MDSNRRMMAAMTTPIHQVVQFAIFLALIDSLYRKKSGSAICFLCITSLLIDHFQRLTDTDPSNAREKLEHLLNQPANKFCADCGIPDPKWA